MLQEKVLQLDDLMKPDDLGTTILNKWNHWKSLRQEREAAWAMTTKYTFATNTDQTRVGLEAWQNNHTIPKLCQILDNLHANYYNTLFSNPDWINWRGASAEEVEAEKAKRIKAYVKTKARLMNLTATIGKSLRDWLLYGNCFAITEYVNIIHNDPEDAGNQIIEYAGGYTSNISPNDIVFDPTAKDFNKTPKIVKSVYNLGDLAQAAKQVGGVEDFLVKAYEQALKNRQQFAAARDMGDTVQDASFRLQGLGTPADYLGKDSVVILRFYGSYFDNKTAELMDNRIITVVDGMHVVDNVENPSWSGQAPIRSCVWKEIPGSLYGQGALENLVGLQHHIDSLENAKADGYNFVMNPPTKTKGHLINNHKIAPGENVDCGLEGDIEILKIDTSPITTDTQIQMYMQIMEEMVGAPKQAMGIRTPGEKTMYEVQSLENASSRLYQAKIKYFEENFLEPILNDILEVGRRNLDSSEIVETENAAYGNTQLFLDITRNDLAGRGKMQAMGARHFAYNANQLQNLMHFLNSPIAQNPIVSSNFSSVKAAQLALELSDLSKYNLVSEGIGIQEQVEVQKQTQEAQEEMAAGAAVSLDERAAVDAELLNLTQGGA